MNSEIAPVVRVVLGLLALAGLGVLGALLPMRATLLDAEPPPVPRPPAVAPDCSKATNVCPDYSVYWKAACPPGARCLTFRNSCATAVALSYNVGCDGDGQPGAPQCACGPGPTVPPGGQVVWEVLDGDYTSCLPSWEPACLTASLAVLANLDTASCAGGTRVEFTAGNAADEYGRFDSYDIDVEKTYYSIPVAFSPDIDCARDHAAHDCRPLYCASADCPDAYATPASGGCPDGRSPQAGCQDTFAIGVGYTVEFCPADCTSGSCPSCVDAAPCLGR
jgi:hypothetical protein